MSGFFKRDKENIVGSAFAEKNRRYWVVALVVTSIFLAFVAPSDHLSKARSWFVGLLGPAKAKWTLADELKAVREKENRRKTENYSLLASGGALGKVFAPRNIAALDFESKLGGGPSVRGILSPEDSEKSFGGLRMATDDLSGTRARVAQSGSGLSRAPAFAGRDFFTGANVPAGDNLATAFASTVFPPTVMGVAASGMQKGVSPRSQQNTSKRIRKGINDNRRPGGNRAIAQLADQHAGMMLAMDPNATMEEAAAAGAAVYDGGRAFKEAKEPATPPRFDGASIPKIPSARDRRIAKKNAEEAKVEEERERVNFSKKRRVRQRRARSRSR